MLLGIKTVEIRGFLGFLFIIGSNRAQKHVFGTPVCPKMFTGNVPVLLMPNDKPQGRGASPRPAGGECWEFFPLPSFLILIDDCFEIVHDISFRNKYLQRVIQPRRQRAID